MATVISRPVRSVRTTTAVAVAILLLLAAPAVLAAGPPGTQGPHGRYPAVGEQVKALPPGHRQVNVGPQSYRYANGSFYRPGPGGAYVVVQAPIGAQVNVLAPGSISFGIAGGRYFYANFTYYIQNEDRTAYVVVEKPEGAEAAVAAATAEVFVYPGKGQSAEQQDRDRYECYRWAVAQTGYDPVAVSADADSARNYQRANAACLEGRGYTVR
ncbi:MAG: hypothetical protein KDI17_02195 [Halioglobus sp.]|nr:hypothetical protein [Halioglobus sp.]